MGFRGWTAEAIEFYEGLEADNSKTYWNENKTVYENCVLRPMTELLAELGPEFGASKLFRPYRDVRFSADKAPYKTTIAATLEMGGYVQLSAEASALEAACGGWLQTSWSGIARPFPPRQPDKRSPNCCRCSSRPGSKPGASML